jgi:hypothetical protein
MRKFLSIAALLAPLWVSAKEPTMVAVFSTADKATNILTTQTDLSEFHRLWSQKTKQEPPHKIDWPYSLRISIGNKSTLWLYNPSGWATILSKTVVPIYKLGLPDDLNHLLGIHNTSLNLTRGANAPLAG